MVSRQLREVKPTESRKREREKERKKRAVKTIIVLYYLASFLCLCVSNYIVVLEMKRLRD